MRCRLLYRRPSINCSMDESAPNDLTDLIYLIAHYISIVIPTAVGLALIVFLWSGVNLIIHSDAPDKRKEAIKRMIWSGIAMFVIVSMAGIVQVLVMTLHLNQ